MIRSFLPVVFIFMSHFCFSQDTVKAVVKLGERIPVRGTKVSIMPPDKFNFSEKINGFIHPGSASSIAITEAEGISWIQLCQNLSQNNLTGQNVTIVSQEDVTLKTGITGRFYVIRIMVHSNDSTKQDIEFERLMLFAGDYNYTVWLNANYPAMLKSVLYATLRESMLSVEIDQPSNSVPDEK